MAKKERGSAAPLISFTDSGTAAALTMQRHRRSCVLGYAKQKNVVTIVEHCKYTDIPGEKYRVRITEYYGFKTADDALSWARKRAPNIQTYTDIFTEDQLR